MRRRGRRRFKRGYVPRTLAALSVFRQLAWAFLMLPAGKIVGDPGAHDRAGMQQALDFIDAHLGERLTLTTLADELRLSPSHFAHVFKRLVGVAPHKYVMRRRLERARLLLVHTDLPIVVIAVELGYANQSHFSEQFHREIGVTPLTYRLHR